MLNKYLLHVFWQWVNQQRIEKKKKNTGSAAEGNGNLCHYSCLRNPMERGPWQTTVHRVAKELDSTEQQNHHHPNWCLCIPHSTFHHLRTLLSQGSCSGQTLVLQNPGDSPQPLACHPARCQNQGPQKTGTHVAPLRYRFGSCDEEQNTPKWSHLNVSLWLTAILAVLSRTGVECGQPSVRSSVQRKMGGGQATSKEAP